MTRSAAKRHGRLLFALAMLTVIGGLALSGCTDATDRPPNVVILFADDMGYGDLSSYGHPTLRTPHLDGLAADGMRFTSFVTASWCTPSRTQLLTGQYMPRIDFGGGTGADGEGGLPDSVLTLAEALKDVGYATGMAGKWHLGYKEARFLPTGQGFDAWLGLPYSNDYRKPWVQTEEPLGLYRGTATDGAEMIEHPINQDSLTVRYTDEAVRFVEEHSQAEHPFFFYLAYNMPHLPIHTAETFRGRSRAGRYGDVVETIDWSVGQVLDALEREGVADNTIVFFASDNGPWLNLPDRMRQEGNQPWHQGTAGPLRNSKATTYEGGTRVPAMIRWPGRIPAHQVSDALAASPDIYRTLIEVAGAEPPDHPIDGHDLMPWLTGQADDAPRERYAYFLGGTLEAMREGRWKLRLASGTPELFDLQVDPGERFNRAEDKPEVVDRLRTRMEQFAAEVGASMPEQSAF